MSWEAIIPPGLSLTPLQLVGLIIAASAGLILIAGGIRGRRARSRRSPADEPLHDHGALSESELGSKSESDSACETGRSTAESVEDDDFLKQAFPTQAEDPDVDDIPSFSSLPRANTRSEREEAIADSPVNARAGDVSSLLFRLLGTKARILELERAEKTKSQVLESTCDALKSLGDSLEGSSSELRDEIDEMHELISSELSTSHESTESVRQLKEIIETQYDLLNKPDAVYSAELLLAKQSYVETIDASLDRRLKNAERRETEFALGKERIMALKKQMLRLKDSDPEIDSTRAH